MGGGGVVVKKRGPKVITAGDSITSEGLKYTDFSGISCSDPDVFLIDKPDIRSKVH